MAVCARPPHALRGVLPQSLALACTVATLLAGGCGYSTRAGLPSYLKTIYIKPFANKIDVTALPTNTQEFPIYRHQMEVSITNAVITRYQFTGLLRPASAGKANCRLEGELMAFRRDALRYDASQQVEEWRLNIVVNLRFIDQTTNTLMWQEDNFTGDTTYFALGANAESETTALDRAITDLARRIVERTVENW